MSPSSARLASAAAALLAFTRYAVSSDTRPFIRVVMHRLLQRSSGGWWMLQLVWSPAHTSSTEDCRGYCTLNCTGSMCQSESRTSSRSVACKVKCRSTWSTSTYQSPTSLLGSILSPPSMTPGPSTTPVANLLPTGFLCCWTVGLELIAWQFERSECHQRQLPQTFENTFVRSVLKHPAH